MAHFIPFMDKENTSQLGVMSHIRTMGPTHTPVGKTFQRSSHQQLKPALRKTVESRDIQLGPDVRRKALGGLNVDPYVQQNARFDGNNVTMKPPAPASRADCRPGAQHREPYKQMPMIETLGSRTEEEEEYPEIEHMPQYEEPEDTFADVWDPSERPDTYIQEIYNWRPSRLYPLYDDDRDRDNSLLEDDRNSTMDSFRVQDLTVEDPELELETDIDCSLIPILPPPDHLDKAQLMAELQQL